MMLPTSSALAMRLSVGLNVNAVTVFFCFIVNTTLDVLIFNINIWPESRQTATMLMMGDGHNKTILILASVRGLVRAVY